MTLKDCYTRLGGDYDEVLGRLRREQTVRKFVFKFLDDIQWMYDLEEITSQNNGAALYMGITGGRRMLNMLHQGDLPEPFFYEII